MPLETALQACERVKITEDELAQLVEAVNRDRLREDRTNPIPARVAGLSNDLYDLVNESGVEGGYYALVHDLLQQAQAPVRFALTAASLAESLAHQKAQLLKVGEGVIEGVVATCADKERVRLVEGQAEAREALSDLYTSLRHHLEPLSDPSVSTAIAKAAKVLGV